MDTEVRDYIELRMTEIVAQGKHINGCCRTSLINELMDLKKIVGANEPVKADEKEPVSV